VESKEIIESEAPQPAAEVTAKAIRETNARLIPSGHWYYEDGRPAYEVPYANKPGLKKTDLRDARKLNLKPSVTHIDRIVAKGVLDRWIKRQILGAARKIKIDEVISIMRNKIKKFQFKTKQLWQEEIMKAAIAEWENQVIELADEQSKVGRELGTSIHDAISMWLQDEPIEVICEHTKMNESVVKPYLDCFGDWYSENIDDSQAKEIEFTIPTTLGYGGRCDLLGRDYNGNYILVDYKSRKKVAAYKSDPRQLSAYSHAIAEGRNISVSIRLISFLMSTSKPGETIVVEYTDQAKHQFQMFSNAFALWKDENNWEG